MNEAAARIRINRLLEEAGWRFFADGGAPGNVRLEMTAAIRPDELAALGEDFERARNGKADFVLLDERGAPLVVLEAKSSDKNPLVGKEQARRYARSLACRFVILSNGNIHYFWDLERGNPNVITSFPTPDSVSGYHKVKPNPLRLVNKRVDADYVAATQRPDYDKDAAWVNESERADFIRANGLRFLRPYQLDAVHALQRAVANGAERFLFEMATGTGKTLVAAAVIKLFLRTGNASRVLFLVDRLELENQAATAFGQLLANDCDTVIYKERRDDWRRAEIVVSTVQSLLFDNKYRALFSPTDFDLVISDEAHRSIGGNARAVFDYFVGGKLGLTATPRDYLKGAERAAPNDPRETERRILRDTYRTFGCEPGRPTFRYSLIDGVRDGYLVNPTLVDARTGITAQMLADDGFAVAFADVDGEGETERAFGRRHFERDFFSESTNRALCRAFMENALTDPVSGEIGKSIAFAVSQDHAARLAQIFNEIADSMFPGKYKSDFAVQVTSSVDNAQGMTVNFANNNLLGSRNFRAEYATSKARVCVTVGMMTTGYDCSDILNLALFRPIFSPTEFVQIKGRGTRLHDFREQLGADAEDYDIPQPDKTTFKLFDFFANCEYFEEEFDYDETLNLPRERSGEDGGEGGERRIGFSYTHLGDDEIESVAAREVVGGMKIDRMLFDRFAEIVREDEILREAVESGRWEFAEDRLRREHFDKPEDYFNLDKLRRAVSSDRRLSARDLLENAFGLTDRFKSKDELLEEEFDKFLISREPPEARDLSAVKAFFKAYAADARLRATIDSRRFAELAATPAFSLADYRATPPEYRALVPEYVKDYVPLNKFIS